MKRKMIALVLSLSMVLGMSMSVSAASTTGLPGEDHATHSNNANAVVSSETDQTDSEHDDYDLNTQFYINVDKDATSGDVEIKEPEDVTGEGDICHYEMVWNVKRTSKISVTVPLYVCMYGYGGDGKIVTPDAYKMTNSSTYSESKVLESITPCYKVIVIEGDVNRTENVGGADTRVYPDSVRTEVVANPEKGSGEYGYYMKDGTATIKKLSECDYHNKADVADGGSDCGNIDRTTAAKEYFFRDSNSIIDSNSINKQVIVGGNTYEVDEADPRFTGVTDARLKVNIPTVESQAQTWTIRPLADAAKLGAGEIVMSINSLDLKLANVQGGLDIRDLEWSIEGNGATLDLPIQAVMAGGSVNEEGCVPVVRMIYTIAPDFSAASTPGVTP